MELQYTVRGADGKEYGPATLEQLNNWAIEGRLPAQLQVRRSDMQYWAPAGDFQELQPLYATGAGTGVAAAPKTLSPPTENPLTSSAQVKSAGAWFYWIAGLSLINSIAAFSGTTWRFILGLGITQILDGLGSKIATGGKVMVLVLDLLAAAIVIGVGIFAQKGQMWAFVVGMILLALDGLIFLLARDWLGVGFHMFVLYCLFRGLAACKSCRR